MVSRSLESGLNTPSVASTQDLQSTVSSNEVRSSENIVPLTTTKSYATLQSATSNLSRLSLSNVGRTITKNYNDLVEAVKDDNAQTDSDRKGNDLNKLLESRFDIGDALRMHDQQQESIEHSSDLEKNSRSLHDSSSSIASIARSPSSLNNKANNNETLEKVFTNKSTGEIELPPDKGYAWVVVGCVFIIMLTTWGCNSAFGIFLSFFLNNNKFPNATRYDYALIAGLTIFLGQGLSPFSILLMRIIGLKITMFFGIVIMAAAFSLASYATQLWHLYVTQGFMIGCAISLIFAPATTILPGWFLRKRAVSMGLSLLGTGAGGVTFGLASNKMIEDNGNTNMCYRMLAITCSVSAAIAVILVKERKPRKPIGIRSFEKIKQAMAKMFSLRVAKQPLVLLTALWFTLALFGYNLMIFTLASYAVARGMTQHQASSLTAILNGAQCIGRPAMGLLGDRFGRANITIVLTFVLCIFMFGFWIPAHTYLQLIFFCIMVGSCVGVANVMNTVLIADLVAPEDFLSAWSFVNYSGSPVLLVVEVVAQALTVSKNKSNPYLHTQIFSGCCFTAALILILVLREYAVRNKLTKRQQENSLKLEEMEDTSEIVQLTSEHWNKLQKRKAKYDILLGNGPKKYFMRMTYPMKV